MKKFLSVPRSSIASSWLVAECRIKREARKRSNHKRKKSGCVPTGSGVRQLEKVPRAFRGHSADPFGGIKAARRRGTLMKSRNASCAQAGGRGLRRGRWSNRLGVRLERVAGSALEVSMPPDDVRKQFDDFGVTAARLGLQLREIYADIAAEPIPSRFARLLEPPPDRPPPAAPGQRQLSHAPPEDVICASRKIRTASR